MRVINVAAMTAASWLSAALAISTNANAQETKHYRFAHDQQLNSGYSVAYDILSAKLKELSKGTMLVDQYPGAQLGQEPQLLQLVKSGDLDFAIVSSANTATISPQAGVMSLHFLFRSEDYDIKSLGDEKVFAAIRDMIDDTVQGIHVIGLGTQGFRHLYGRFARWRILRASRSAFRPPPRKIRCSRLMARKPCTCRSAVFIRRCKPGSSILPRTRSTSI
jgi:TRAP-type C4-dicarboxylate transport system substrate-binding protein